VDACPVKIDIPGVLVHLRGRITEEIGAPRAERLAMGAVARVFASRRRYESAQKAATLGAGPVRAASWFGPLAGWTMSRELPVPPAQTFRDWWRNRG
jgi:L-lactate dehydrogenase complex protein LldF